MKSSEMFERAKKVSPGGVHSPVRGFGSLGRPPVFFEKAEGAHLTSVEGDRYIDFCQSFGPNILGHRDPEVMEEVHQAVSEAWTFGAADPYSLEFAEFITEKLSFLDMVRFVNSGTEAVMSSLRVARAVTKRDKILKFEGCYHGHVDSMLVKAGSGLAGLAASSSAGVSDEIAKQTVVVPLNDLDAFQQAMTEHGQDIAAVIIEPLPANYGLLIQAEAYLKEVEKLTKENCSLLILDEVISGFRVHLGGMAAHLNLEPDLVTYGKIIGGGFPVGCYGGKKEFMNMVAPMGPVYQAGTLSANPVAMRAGHATLKKCIEADIYKLLEQRTANFCKQLDSLFENFDQKIKTIQFGSLFWLCSSEIDQYRTPNDIPSDHMQRFNPLYLQLLKRGIYLAPNAYEVGFLSLAHTDQILEETLSKFSESLEALANA